MSDVVYRTAWCEKIKRGPVEVTKPLPFYTVRFSGVVGSFFEPVDCASKLSLGSKEVNETIALKWGRQAGLSDEAHGQSDITLHSFCWGWPI
jgi:hypothetical protein